MHAKTNSVLSAGILVALAVPGIIRAAQDPAMLQSDRAFVEAVAKADKPALEKLLDADFTWTDFEGKTLTRAQVLQNPPKPAIPDDVKANDVQKKQYTYGELGDVQANLGRAHALRVW